MNESINIQSIFNAYKALRGVIKKNNWVFSIHRHLTDKDYQREKKRMATCTMKSKKQIECEMTEYARYWRCPADDYVRYGLFEKRLTTDEILDYVPMHYYYCDYVPKVYKGYTEGEKDDKLGEYRRFMANGIPTPEVIASIKNRQISATGGGNLDFSQLIDLTQNSEKLFIKPNAGSCGNGIVVLSKQNGKLLYNMKPVSSLDDLSLSASRLYIVQRGLVQRDDLSRINSSSLNTLRTIVRYENGKPLLLGIILRMGRKGSLVDNSGQGGVSVGVNLSDGKFMEFAGREHGGSLFPQHPDSGFIFKGHGIENWPTVKWQIDDIIARETNVPIAGWDLAIGADGRVYAIEQNPSFGIEHAQIVLGGFRKKLGIKL